MQSFATSTTPPPLQGNFDMGRCDDHKGTAYLALLALGAAFRLLAFVALKYTASRKR